MNFLDLKFFFTESCILFSAIFILIYGIFSKDSENFIKNIYFFIIFILFFSLYLSFSFIDQDLYAFNDLLNSNNFSNFFKILILLLSIILASFSYKYLKDLRIITPEFYFLFLIAILGTLIMVLSNDLLSMYLGLELQSICLYILSSYKKNLLKSSESGVKFFILGALSSGILLYGLSLIYGFTNSTNFNEIAIYLSNPIINNQNNLLVSTGFILVLSGFLFKIALVPFHMWAPDVYEGSPTPITAFFATIPKIGAIAILIKFLNIPFDSMQDTWFIILYSISIISMIFASVAAINQENIKRLLAYSSIGHLGFIMLGVLVSNESGIKGIEVYLLIYSLTILAIFAIILCCKDDKDGNYIESIKSFSGLLKKNTFLAVSLTILLFSLAGIPPTAGFFGKLYILAPLIQNELYVISIIAVLTSVISAFYYLRIIKVTVFDNLKTNIFCETPVIYKIFINLVVIFNVIFIIIASDILSYIEQFSFLNKPF